MAIHGAKICAELLKQWSEWSHPNLVKLEAFYLKAENPVPWGLSHFAEHASLETYLKQEILSQTDYIKLVWFSFWGWVLNLVDTIAS